MEYTLCSKKQITDTASVNHNTQASQCLKQVANRDLLRTRPESGTLRPLPCPGSSAREVQRSKSNGKREKQRKRGRENATLPPFLLPFKSLTSEAAERITM